jgi:hypothetical protein
MFGFFDTIKKWFTTQDVAIDNVVDASSKPKKKTKKELEQLTKKQLEEFGREIEIELDRRLTKAKLVNQLVQAQRKSKGE